MKVCERCRAVNSASARFCKACGAPVAPLAAGEATGAARPKAGDTVALCMACGGENPQLAKFCRLCGASLKHEVVGGAPTTGSAATDVPMLQGALTGEGNLVGAVDEGSPAASGWRPETGPAPTGSGAARDVGEPSPPSAESADPEVASSAGRPDASRAAWYAAAGILIIAAIGGGGYWAWNEKHQADLAAKQLEEARLAEAKRLEEEAARKEEELQRKLKEEEERRQLAEQERRAAEARAAREAQERRQAELRAAEQANARRQAEAAAIAAARAREDAQRAAREAATIAAAKAREEAQRAVQSAQGSDAARAGPVGYEVAAAAFQRGDNVTAQSACLAPAQSGDARCQYLMGALYVTGKVGSRSQADLRLAAQWFTRAAQQNHAPSQFALGALYEQGAGVPRNLNTAVGLYQRAAAQGDQNAMKALARLYSGRRKN